jgi:hypothetical protein
MILFSINFEANFGPNDNNPFELEAIPLGFITKRI